MAKTIGLAPSAADVKTQTQEAKQAQKPKDGK